MSRRATSEDVVTALPSNVLHPKTPRGAWKMRGRQFVLLGHFDFPGRTQFVALLPDEPIPYRLTGKRP